MKCCLNREISLPLFRVIARAECLHDVYRSYSSASNLIHPSSVHLMLQIEQQTDPSASIDINSLSLQLMWNHKSLKFGPFADMGILSRADKLLTVTMVDGTRITASGRTGRVALCCWKLNGLLLPIKWMCLRWAPLCPEAPGPEAAAEQFVSLAAKTRIAAHGDAWSSCLSGITNECRGFHLWYRGKVSKPGQCGFTENPA